MTKQEARTIIDMMLDGLLPWNQEMYWKAVHRIEYDDKIDEYVTRI